MNYHRYTLKNRYQYLKELKDLNRKSWPEFFRHGETPSWERIFDELSDFLLLLVSSDNDLVAAGVTVPAVWSGQIAELPETIETIITNGVNVKERSPNTLIAIAALVDEEYRGGKLSAEILKQMKNLAKERAIQNLDNTWLKELFKQLQ